MIMISTWLRQSNYNISEFDSDAKSSCIGAAISRGSGSGQPTQRK